MKNRSKKHLLINEHQFLLLKACCHHNLEEAARKYSVWKSGLIIKEKEGQKILVEVFDQLDAGSRRLLPFLYKKLKNLLPQDSLIQPLRGYYRHCWYKNQILINELKKVVSILKQQNIPTIVTKGLALSQLYYRDFGSRPMSDIDLMVKEEDADRALVILQEQQWQDKRTQRFFPSIRETITDSRTLINNKNVELDFHWRFLKEAFDNSWNSRIWNQKIALSIQGCEINTLKPSDQLLHTLVHGLEWNEVPSLRWALDAHMIIKHSEVDWDDFFSTSKNRNLLPFAQSALPVLKDLGSPISKETITQFKKSYAGFFSKAYANQKLKPRRPGSLNHIILRLYQIHLFYPDSFMKGLKKMVKSFSANWALQSSFKTPFIIVLQILNMKRHPGRRVEKT